MVTTMGQMNRTSDDGMGSFYSGKQTDRGPQTKLQDLHGGAPIWRRADRDDSLIRLRGVTASGHPGPSFPQPSSLAAHSHGDIAPQLSVAKAAPMTVKPLAWPIGS